MARQAKIQLIVDSAGAIKAVGATNAEFQDLKEEILKLEKELGNLSDATQAGIISPQKSAQQEARLLEKHLRLMIDRGVDPASAGFRRYAKVLDQMQAEQATAVSTTRGMAQSSNTASLAMMDMTRIVEDSAFGIRGMANNINPAVQSFGRLKAETGSTTGALKGMLATLGTPGTGLMLAFALLSSAAIALGPKLKEAFGEGSEAAEEFKKKAEEAFDAIFQFEANIEGVKFTPETIGPAIDRTTARIENLRGNLKTLKDALEALGPAGSAANRFIPSDAEARRTVAMFADSEESARELVTILQDEIEKSETHLQQMRTAEERMRDQKDVKQELLRLGGELVRAEEGRTVELQKQTGELRKQHAARIAFLDLLASRQGKMEGRGPQRVTGADFDMPSELQQMAEALGLSEDQLRTFAAGMEKLMQDVKDGLSENQDQAEQTFDTFTQGVQAAVQAVGVLQQAFNNAHQSRMNEINAQRRAALNAIDEQLDKRNLSERERVRLLEKRSDVEERFREKEREALKEQAKRNKAIALFDIAINTAVAVSKVWGQTGLAGAIFQGVALGMGAAQAALVAAQPIPEFRHGGDNVSGVVQVHKDELIALPESSSVISQANSRRIMEALERPSPGAASFSDDRLVSAVQRVEQAVDEQTRRLGALEVRFDMHGFQEAFDRQQWHEMVTGRDHYVREAEVKNWIRTSRR